MRTRSAEATFCIMIRQIIHGRIAVAIIIPYGRVSSKCILNYFQNSIVISIQSECIIIFFSWLINYVLSDYWFNTHRLKTTITKVNHLNSVTSNFFIGFLIEYCQYKLLEVQQIKTLDHIQWNNMQNWFTGFLHGLQLTSIYWKFQKKKKKNERESSKCCQISFSITPVKEKSLFPKEKSM